MPNTPQYDVVSPVGQPVGSAGDGRKPARSVTAAAPFETLASKKIGFIWTKFRNGDLLLAAFADLLAQRFPGMEFVKLPSGKTLPWGDYPDRSFAEVLREHKVDGLIAAPAC
jgi:hypothetical protein